MKPNGTEYNKTGGKASHACGSSVTGGGLCSLEECRQQSGFQPEREKPDTSAGEGVDKGAANFSTFNQPDKA